MFVLYNKLMGRAGHKSANFSALILTGKLSGLANSSAKFGDRQFYKKGSSLK
jgi:hypothetical protein